MIRIGCHGLAERSVRVIEDPDFSAPHRRDMGDHRMQSKAEFSIRPPRQRAQKRADLVAEDIKLLITQRNLSLGDRLPLERELQDQFQVSKGTIREALKSLEVQGLIRISTGPKGGATLVEVPLDRTVQFVQNYLFFKDVDMSGIYASRRLLEPELAASVVPYLTDEHFRLLEENIQICTSHSSAGGDLISLRQADLDFHDILASASKNSFLRFNCEIINALLRKLVVYSTSTPQDEHVRFGCANARCHEKILAAARVGNADLVRTYMREHMDEAYEFVQHLKGRLDGRLLLDAEMMTRRIGRLS